jgi:hypothetical protein
MQERTYDEGSDTVCEESVYKIGIELDTLRVNGIIATAQRNNPRPGNGKPVGFDTIFRQQLQVLLPQPVRVGGNISVSSV